jgi:hypothetical protein
MEEGIIEKVFREAFRLDNVAWAAPRFLRKGKGREGGRSARLASRFPGPRRHP